MRNRLHCALPDASAWEAGEAFSRLSESGVCFINTRNDWMGKPGETAAKRPSACPGKAVLSTGKGGWSGSISVYAKMRLTLRGDMVRIPNW